MQDLDNDDLEYLASQARADHVADELRDEVERLKAELHNVRVDKAIVESEVERLRVENEDMLCLCNKRERTSRVERSKANAMDRRLSRIAAISHNGGLAGLSEGGALNMVRALTVAYMEKSDTRDEQITRLNEAMAAARDESKARHPFGDNQ